MNQEMTKGLYSVISPSNANKYNELNPFRFKIVQLRNFLIIHFMLNYGLRISELMLLTTNSIKKSIQNHNFSLIITNKDNEHDSI